MSRLGESVLKLLLSLRRPPATMQRTVDEECDAYFDWQFQSSARLFARYPDFDVAGKSVLEIGCGTGGRTAFVAARGASRVVGIDINAVEIAIANRLSRARFPELGERLEYLASSESSPLPIGPFDVVLLVDCMEHVVSPPAMMRLAFNYTRPGGKCYFSCFGYYHRHGSHMGMIPFANVFFSDETILNVTRWLVSRPDYVRMRFDSDPPVERWRGIYDLRDRPGEHLNKLTLRDIKKLVRHSIFDETRTTVVGFGDRHRLLRLIDFLRYVPWIQEVYHSYVVVECRKARN